MNAIEREHRKAGITRGMFMTLDCPATFVMQTDIGALVMKTAPARPPVSAEAAAELEAKRKHREWEKEFERKFLNYW